MSDEVALITNIAKGPWIRKWLREKGLLRTISQSKRLRGTNQPGLKKGKLTLLHRVRNGENPKWIWVCKCDCGKTKSIPEQRLNGSSPVKSCGCMMNPAGKINRSWRGCEELSASLFNSYIRNAESRGLSFDITIWDAWNLFENQNRKCALTGVPLRFATTAHGSDGNASLDRIDSCKGYSIDNVQWVHKWVNILKSGLNDKDLFRIVKAIYEHKALETMEMPRVEFDSSIDRILGPHKPRNSK